MKYFNVIAVALLFFIPLHLSAQSTSIPRYADTLRYEVKYGRIIIPVQVQDRVYKYILDTGGQTATMWTDVQQAKGQLTGSNQVTTDMNGQSNMYSKATLPDVKIGRYLHLNTLSTIVLPEVQGFRDLGVVGILGGDTFKNVVLVLDGSRQELRIFYPYRPKGLKLSDGIPIADSQTWHVNFPLTINETSVQVMFDTGVPELLTLNNDDYQKLFQAKAATVVQEGEGSVGAGLEGLAPPKSLKYVRVGAFKLGGKTFNQAASVVAAGIPTILGAELLRHGVVTIDYPRSRFYFQPYDLSAADLSQAPHIWNVGIMPANQRFEVTTVWGTTSPQVKIGDEVIAINGKDITALPLSEMTIVDILREAQGNQAKITVRRDSRKFDITIHRF
jgi:hypothetical protein